MKKGDPIQPTSDPNVGFADRFHAVLSGNVHLSEEIRAEFVAAMKPVLESLGRVAHVRLNQTVRDFQFFESPEALRQYINKKLGKKRSQNVQTGGAYTWRVGESSGELLLNGALDDRYHTTAIYAHEVGHALDGPNKEISGQRDWSRAWRQEIKQEGAISPRARLSAYEGFAEFCRYCVTSAFDDDTLKSLFPKCTAIWKRYSS